MQTLVTRVAFSRLSPSTSVLDSALMPLLAGRLEPLKHDQPTVTLTVFQWGGCDRLSTCTCVCVGGVPHTLLFSCESLEVGMSASQLSSTETAMEEKKGALAVRHLRTSSHLLCEGRECVHVCMLGGHTMAALTRFGLACIFNPSNAKLSVVLFRGTLLKSVTVPRPRRARTMGHTGSTRGSLNASEQQGWTEWGQGGFSSAFRRFHLWVFAYVFATLCCSCRKTCFL